MLKLSELALLGQKGREVRQDDASKPCAWHFYKRAELIPDEVYERAGRGRPDGGEGRY